MKTPAERARFERRAAALLDRVVDDLRSSGRLERRDFVRLGSLALGSALLAGCNSQGPKWADRWLKSAEKQNERVERWLFSHDKINQGAPGAYLAGDKFPSYFISPTVPMWDYTKGPWFLEIGGAVKKPVKVSLMDLIAVKSRRQRIEHFCVEGWSAVEILTGALMSEVARLVEPTSDANYVDFVSFDKNYHESWDIESALHPQTIVAYAKEDNLLSPAYGAPARIHSPVKLGYKNTKYLTKIMFMPERNGGYWSDIGYEWYGGT
ncbi:MAG: molybdopterin-dependent oxidoreductase [Phycisphaerae bacterium]|nr:molybdopterin-dependent oxidoreductase [Gemmatimonadaceae bacterium]